MALPDPPEDACFVPSVFQSETFSVDEFVSDCKKRVSTEHLHDDLKSYYSTLKAAMVELINKDYSDFLDLSANLVGMDKQIDSIALPLSQLHEEIMIIKHSMAKATMGLEDKMAAREEIRQQKMILKKAIDSVNSTELLERLLERRNQDGEEGLDRIAMEFNKLRHNMSTIDATNIPLLNGLTKRIEKITNQLQAILEEMLTNSLDKKDHQLLHDTLETYRVICNVEAAEDKIREIVVAPALKQVVSARAVVTDPQGLEGMYSNILKFIPKHCGFILEVSQGIPPFDVLVNAVWAEIVSSIETRASVVFAPGNPETFHKNYCSTVQFLDDFESKWCRSVEHVKVFRSHPAYLSFLNKWSLPVYFQIRFQEIGGKLENHLELPLKEEVKDDGLFTIEVFRILYSCVSQCWAEEVYLLPLAHRFWKLTLQLIVRFRTWLGEVLNQPNSQVESQQLSITQCIKLVHDIHVIADEILKLFEDSVKQKLEPIVGKERSTVQRDVLSKSVQSLEGFIPCIDQCITAIITQQSIKNLDPVQTIPRLYRRTNREIPTKPSGYVHNVLKPLTQVDHDQLVNKDHTDKWKTAVVEIVTEKYREMTSEVLDNVKRTEDSLLKLKRNRRSVQIEQHTATGMSDDNKIRLQLAIDIQAYANEVREILSQEIYFPSFQNLIDMASLAKTTAVTSSS